MRFLFGLPLLGLIVPALALPSTTSDPNATVVELEGRSIVMKDCSADRANNVNQALHACGDLASQAALMAVGGDEVQFVRYFKTADPKIREIVGYRFAAVADECYGRTSLSKSFCTETGKQICKSNWIAVTIGNQIVRCDWYWKLPFLSDKCHGEDQVTKTIHEMTHIQNLHGPVTTDFPGGYGWAGVNSMNANQAYMNADSYAFYANAIRFGKAC